MPALSIMFKTVSSSCNLDCSYCYYRESHAPKGKTNTTALCVLEKLIPEYMDYVADTRAASIGWQGGEPTLAGLNFFEEIVRLEKAHAHPGTVISNDLQTNGTRLDGNWAAFLKQYDFLVGVSLDGPEEIHDQLRTDRRGNGTFRAAMDGARILLQYGVDLNILCVVAPHNLQYPGALLDFYRGAGFSHVQFMPAMTFQATDPDTPAGYLITPEEYGSFLTALFDAWYRDGLPTTSVRTFDNLLQSYLQIPNDLCIHADTCDSGLVVEHNGDVFPCDFHLHEQHKLGNILSRPLISMVNSPERLAFIRQKKPLPGQCRKCPWVAYCKGGCPRNRTHAETMGPDFFCGAYRRLFAHAHERLERLRDKIRNKTIYLAKTNQMKALNAPSPGRNDPCPCGSGRKHKTCCGNPAQEQCYLFQF